MTVLLSAIASMANVAFVATSQVKLRKLPCTCSKVVATIPKGASIEVLNIEKEEGWAHVRHNEVESYAELSSLSHSDFGIVSAMGYSDAEHSTNDTHINTASWPEQYRTAPAGATALCKDGTYSYSKRRRGTCSHHGGVAKWLKNVPNVVWLYFSDMCYLTDITKP